MRDSLLHARIGRYLTCLLASLCAFAVALPLCAQDRPRTAPELKLSTALAPHQLQALAADGALRQRLFALMESQGVVGLAIAPLGEHVLATAKAPVESPADCRGLRVRVMPLRPVLDVYLALGVLPQSMSFALAQAALSAGTLDGQDTMPTTLVATRAYASGQKFVTRWGAFADVMIFA